MGNLDRKNLTDAIELELIINPSDNVKTLINLNAHHILSTGFDYRFEQNGRNIFLGIPVEIVPKQSDLYIIMPDIDNGDGNAIMFRPCRESMADILGSTVIINSRSDIVEILIQQFEPSGKMVLEEELEIFPHKHGKRIGWETHAVMLDGIGVVGYTNSQL